MILHFNKAETLILNFTVSDQVALNNNRYTFIFAFRLLLYCI